jgi:hypothetical protein
MRYAKIDILGQLSVDDSFTTNVTGAYKQIMTCHKLTPDKLSAG